LGRLVLVGLPAAGAGRGVVWMWIDFVGGGAGLLAGAEPGRVVLAWVVAAGAGALALVEGLVVAADGWLGALALRVLGWVGLGGVLAASPQPASIAAAARTLSAGVGRRPFGQWALACPIGRAGVIGAGARR